MGTVAWVPPAMTQVQPPAQAQERIFGSQLMTEQERLQYRERMLKAKTAEERERIRAEHHQAMTARAKERGVTLPDEPMPGGGMGMGRMGGGMGGGMGPPAGAGPGRVQ
jgi:hypothetical protein